MHYNYHRYYDPDTGRYLTPDPIGLVGRINLFVYVGGNPVNETDRRGLWGDDLEDWENGLIYGTPISTTNTWSKWEYHNYIAEGGEGFFFWLAVRCICKRTNNKCVEVRDRVEESTNTYTNRFSCRNRGKPTKYKRKEKILWIK